MLGKLNFNKMACCLVLVLATHTLALSAANAKEYVIGVEAVRYYPLYDFTTNDSSKPSFTKDILVHFFEAKNYQYKLVPLPIKRFAKAYVKSPDNLNAEHIDFKFPDNINWYPQKSEQQKITFSQPVIELLSGTFVHKANRHLKRRDIKKLGTILGFYPTHWINEVKSNQVALQQETTPFSVVRHLLSGNIDATNINVNVINYNLKLLGKQGEVVLNKNMPYQQYAYHLSSLHYTEIIEEFNDYLNDNKALIIELKHKYAIDENF